MIEFNEQRLLRLLLDYIAYYNSERVYARLEASGVMIGAHRMSEVYERLRMHFEHRQAQAPSRHA